jgi:hypothetical protein
MGYDKHGDAMPDSTLAGGRRKFGPAARVENFFKHPGKKFVDV